MTSATLFHLTLTGKVTNAFLSVHKQVEIMMAVVPFSLYTLCKTAVSEHSPAMKELVSTPRKIPSPVTANY